jgi:hypothetical protein
MRLVAEVEIILRFSSKEASRKLEKLVLSVTNWQAKP